MLILTRTVEQAIVIGDGIIVKVLEVRGRQVRLGITAPDEVNIVRQELVGDLVKPEGEH